MAWTGDENGAEGILGIQICYCQAAVIIEKAKEKMGK